MPVYLHQIKTNKIDVDMTDLLEATIRRMEAATLRLEQLIPVTEKKEERLLTSNEACEFLRCSKPTLHRWKSAGILPHVRIGTNIRYKESDLKKLIESRNK